jgi:transmembrane sensor
MSASPQSSASLSPEIRAEAAAWVARLHGSGRNSSLQAALNTWLASNPLHARAFEVATEAWELGGAVVGAALPRIDPKRRQRPRMGLLRPLLAGGVIALIGIAPIFYFRDTAITTTTGEQRSVTLEDGTRIALNTDTRLVVHYTEQQRRVRLEMGEAFFDVAKNPHRPFVVVAGKQSVIALGTAFMVRRNDDELDVTLLEGKVSVTNAAPVGSAVLPSISAGRILAPGQRLRIAGFAPTIIDRPSIEAVTAWRRGEVVLDHTRLADAVQEMNRYSPEKLIIFTPASGDIPVSGIFRAGDSARFAHAIADTYHLRVVEEPSRIVLAGTPGGKEP